MTYLKDRVSVIAKRWPYWWMYTIGVVVLLVACWLGYVMVYLNTQRVFWNMLSGSLATQGVTIHASQGNGTQEIQQYVQFELGNKQLAHSYTRLTQGNTVVKTEIIGTPKVDYTRYLSIKTDQKTAAGKPLNISKVVGIWARSPVQAQSSTEASGQQLFAQAVLGIGLPVGAVPVPIGNLTVTQRAKLMQYIRDQQVYQVSFKDVKKERKGGHLLYTYPVKIQTVLYIRLMKNFASYVGLHELDKVDPNSYQSSPVISLKLVVDAQSRQLVQVVRSGVDYKQSYESYGLPVNVVIPKQAISSTEFQKRLSEL